MLDRRGPQFVGDLAEQRLAGSAVIAEDAYLDQPMGSQGGIDLLDDGRGEAIGTDHDDRLEVVGRRAVFLALGGGQFNCRHGRIIVAT